jgi:hypothetical protein
MSKDRQKLVGRLAEAISHVSMGDFRSYFRSALTGVE